MKLRTPIPSRFPKHPLNLPSAMKFSPHRNAKRKRLRLEERIRHLENPPALSFRKITSASTGTHNNRNTLPLLPCHPHGFRHQSFRIPQNYCNPGTLAVIRTIRKAPQLLLLTEMTPNSAQIRRIMSSAAICAPASPARRFGEVVNPNATTSNRIPRMSSQGLARSRSLSRSCWFPACAQSLSVSVSLCV